MNKFNGILTAIFLETQILSAYIFGGFLAVACVRGFFLRFSCNSTILFFTLSLRSVLSRHANVKFVMPISLSLPFYRSKCHVVGFLWNFTFCIFLQNYLHFKTFVWIAQNNRSSLWIPTRVKDLVLRWSCKFRRNLSFLDKYEAKQFFII